MPNVQVAHPHKVNLVHVTDLHLAAVPPGKRRNSYADEMLRKLEWVGELAGLVQGAVVCSGDVFHIKNPKSPSNVHGFVNRVMAALQRFPGGKMYGQAGNHDLTGDNPTSLPDQPLGLLVTAGVYHNVVPDSVIFTSGSGDVRVQVDAFDYSDGETLLQAILARGARSDFEAMEFHQLDWTERPYHYRVALVHGFNKPGKSGTIFKDFQLGRSDLEQAGYDVFLWGHDHARKGILRSDGDKGDWHVQLGSLSRASLSSDEVDRPVSAAVISFSQEGIKVIEKPVPVTPLDLAFHTATSEVDRVEARNDVSAFLSELDAKATEVTSEKPLDILKTLTDDPEVLKTIQDVCELH